jgi:hypothetical protein
LVERGGTGFNRRRNKKPAKKKKRKQEGIADAQDGWRRECRTLWTAGKRGESDGEAQNGRIYRRE